MHDLTRAIDKINSSSTLEAKVLLEKNAHVSKAGVFVRSYASFLTGLFSKSNGTAPIFFRGIERMLHTMLTNLKLLKLQKKI